MIRSGRAASILTDFTEVALRFAPLLLAALITLAPATVHAQARPFELIHADRVDVTLPENHGVMLGAVGFGVLVNTGPVPITVAEMEAAEFQTTVSVAGFTLTPILYNYYTLGDLPPGHARGTALPIYEALLLPGDQFEPAPGQYLIFHVMRSPGTTYEGPVTIHITMSLVGSWLEFDLLADMRLGSPNVTFTHAVRQAATFPPVPTRQSTWGAIKLLYR